MDTYSIRQFENCVNIKKVLMAVGKKRKKRSVIDPPHFLHDWRSTTIFSP